MNKKVKCAFTSDEIYELLGGYWYTDDDNIDFQRPFFTVDYFTTGTGLVEFPNTCFVAMTKETWLRGSGNGGHYKNIFSDSHISLVNKYPTMKTKNNLVGIIAERQIPELYGILPQLIVDNPYEAIKVLAVAARDKMADNGTIIAVTGAVGKSTTVNMLHCLLNDESDYISNINGHNSRTGVPMWTASVGRFNPEFKQSNDKPNVCTLEIAAAALWMRSGGICKIVKPHIGVITHIALTQWQQGSRNIRDVAIAKSKVCQGIVPGGKAVLYHDMPEFDFIKETVTNYGAIPVTYGEESSCDTYVKKYEFETPTAGEEIVELSTNIDAVVLGEEISYKIGTIGKPVVLNSLAALTAAKLAGFNIYKIAPKFTFFKGNEHTLQLSNCGGVSILDCTLTLEIPSIIAAFDLLKKIKQKPGSRKIVLLSRIVNLGDKAPELHLQLTEPISKSGFDKFFFHEPLDEFKYLINTIPSKISGGRYNTAEKVVDAITDYVREGDSILVMGAARGCDFGDVLGLLSKKILANKASGKLAAEKTEIKEIISKVVLPGGSTLPSCVAYSLDNKKRIMESGNMSVTINEGIGHIFILRLILSLLIQGKVRLTDSILMGEVAWRERNVPNALSVSAEESINLKTVLDAYITVNAPDAIIALSHFIFPKANMTSRDYFKQICLELSLDTKVAINLTGRKNSGYEQCYAINDLEKIAAFFFSLPLDAYMPLKATAAVHKEKILKTNSILHSVTNIVSYYCFGTSSFNAIVHAKIRGEHIAAAVCGAKSAFARDTAVCDLLAKLENPKNHEPDEWISVDATRGFSGITIAGDTYFGEMYARQRQRNGQTDVLQKYGYSYLFEKVAPLLPEKDYNIVNFEAVLTENMETPFNLHNDFILDASPVETIKELKHRNINAIMLANNHSLDFGDFTGRQSRRMFIENGFRTVGLGDTIEEAERPLCFYGADRRIIFFNAYWYREPRHYVSRHYAMGNNTGTACISDSFLNRIAEYREKYPDAFIIFSPHWGTDFAEPNISQKRLAETVIQAGVDCIIGHGAHVLSRYELICGKFVIYSIGNFVFDSNDGDFIKKNMPPNAYVAKLLINKDSVRLRLYPIAAYNPDTFLQPYPVTEEQFSELLSRHPMEPEVIKRDDIGCYLEFVL